MTDPTSRQRGRPKNDKTETFKNKKNKNLWSKVPYLGSTPRHTDWLTDRQSQSDFEFDFDFEYLAVNCEPIV
jgi:hypothetical protein